MSIYCRHPDCSNIQKISVNHVKGIVRYTIETCMDHGEWARNYLQNYIESDRKKEKANASERMEKKNRTEQSQDGS